MVPTSPQRIVARWLKADSFGDPKDLFQKLAEVKKNLANLITFLPDLLEGEKVIQENYRYRWTPPPEKKEVIQRLEQAEENVGQEMSSATKTLGLVCRNLFFSIIQQYTLPNDVRRKVESQLKFWSKRVPFKIKGRSSEVFLAINEIVITTYDTAKKALESGKPLSESKSTTSVGSFTLVNTGGFPPKVIEGAVKALEQAERLLRSKGLGKVCYGDAFITNTILKSTTYAFYQIDKDEMFIRANFRKPVDLIYNIIHELGHRLYYKFLSPDQKKEVRQLYWSLSSSSGRSHPDIDYPKPGDTLQIGTKVNIVDRTLGSKIFIRKPEEISSNKYINFKDYAVAKAESSGLPPFGDEGFVTSYAAKNEYENFAEMIANYCLGKLKPTLVEKLTSIIKS